MHGQVTQVQWLTPHMIRVVLGGDGLDDFEGNRFTDAYLNIALPPAGASYAAPFDIADVVERLPRAQWPIRRRYTVRRWDPSARLLTIDFVVHGDAGVAGPWAANARVGDILTFTGPGGAYRPDADADWHLMVGDESALPAIGASLEAVPEGAPVVVRLVVDGPGDELGLDTPGILDVEWLHRTGDAHDVDLMVEAVRALPFPPGRVHAFVHGEAGEVRAVRRHLLLERAIPREDLSASAYWRREMTDEAWREIKADWQAEEERDVA